MLFLTHSGSVQFQREVRWYVPPVPLSQEKQSMASRSTWRFARRFVGVPEWEHQNKKNPLCSQRLMSFILRVCAWILRCYLKSDFILATFVRFILSKWVQHKALSTELKFPPWFIVLTVVLLDTCLTGAHCTLSGAFTAILLISRQKNNNPGPVNSVFPFTVYSMLLLT